MPAFRILHIDHVVLRVADLQRSLAFYRDVLGCPVRRRRESLGMIHLAAGSSLIDLVSLQGPLGRQGGRGAEQEGAMSITCACASTPSMSRRCALT